MKLLVFISFLLIGCSLFPLDHPIEDTYRGYVIEKNSNTSKGRVFLPKDGNTLRFEAILLGDCFYEAKDSAIQKLYGFTDVNSTVHKNSARFGWRTTNRGDIDIFAYWYSDGKMRYQWMGSTLVEVENQYSIDAAGEYYDFKFNDKSFKAKRSKNIERGYRARLFPYFEDGKGNGAPHQMTIYIHEFN